MEIYRVPNQIELPSGLIIPRAIELDFRGDHVFALLHDRHSYEMRFVMSTRMRSGINVASLYLVEDDLVMNGMDQNQISANVYVLSSGKVINGFDITQADKFFSPLDLQRLNNYNPMRGPVHHDHN